MLESSRYLAISTKQKYLFLLVAPSLSAFKMWYYIQVSSWHVGSSIRLTRTLLCVRYSCSTPLNTFLFDFLLHKYMCKSKFIQKKLIFFFSFRFVTFLWYKVRFLSIFAHCQHMITSLSLIPECRLFVLYSRFFPNSVILCCCFFFCFASYILTLIFGLVLWYEHRPNDRTMHSEKRMT